MTRVATAILTGQGYAQFTNAQITDLRYGGQQGWTPVPEEWVSNAGYVPKPLIPILLEAPKFFQLMPNPQKWVEALKALVEVHPIIIEGINDGQKIETDTHNVGRAGEMMHEPTDAKRDQTEPKFTWVEKTGNAIQRFIQMWMDYGIMNPETGTCLAATLIKNLPEADRPKDWLPDWYSMTCLFIEPNALHDRVVRAHIVAGMWPYETTEIAGKMDKTGALELKKSIQIPFTGFAQRGLGVDLFAQKILDAINLTNANPNLRPAFIQDISADVKAAPGGWQSYVEDLGTRAVTPKT